MEASQSAPSATAARSDEMIPPRMPGVPAAAPRRPDLDGSQITATPARRAGRAARISVISTFKERLHTGRVRPECIADPPGVASTTIAKKAQQEIAARRSGSLGVGNSAQDARLHRPASILSCVLVSKSLAS
jgi:hypothetical protein